MKKILLACFALLILAGGVWYWLQNRITFSVIIPIYNSEKYLAKCLDSIFVQKGSFEVIAVNDGSTDNSLNILEQYAKKHSNMKIITQKNQGVSAARNAGFKVAKNKYVTFIDSDDWLEPDAFSIVQKVLKKDNSDVLLNDYYDVYDRQWVRETKGEMAALQVPEETKFPKRDIEKLSLFSPFYAKDTISDLYYYGGVFATHCFLRRKFLTDNHLEFSENINLSEDLIFMYRIFSYNPFISVLNKPIYNYYNRATSAAKSLSVLTHLLPHIRYMQQTKEYQKFPRYVQMWIDDSFVGTLFLCIANLQRHKIPLAQEINKIYEVYLVMSKYNQQELKSARKYQELKTFFKQIGLNRPL